MNSGSLPFRVLLSAHCNRVRCEPDWHLGPDWAPRLRDYDLWFVSAGRGRMFTSTGELTLAPGVGLWMRPADAMKPRMILRRRWSLTSFTLLWLIRRAGSPRRSKRSAPPTPTLPRR